MEKRWLKVGLLGLLMAIVVWLNVSAVTPADASTLKDGNYAIPATLVKSDGTTSTAAKFFAPTAQVTVASGQAKINLAMQNDAEKYLKSVTVAGQNAVSGSALVFTMDSAKAKLPVTFSLQIPTLGAMTQSAIIDLDWSGVPTVTTPDTTSTVTTPTATPTVTAESDSSTPAVVTPTATQTTKKTKTTKTVTKPKLTVKAVKAKAKTVKGTATAGAKVRVKQHQKTLGTATATKKGTFTVKLKRAVKAKARLTVTATKAKATTKKTVTVKAAVKKATPKKTKKAAKAFTVKTPTGTWRATGKKQYAQVWTFSQKTGLTQKLYRHNKKVKTLVAYATYHVTPKTTTFWKVTYAPRHAKTKTMYLRFTSPKRFKVVNAHNHVVKTAVVAAPATTWTFNKQ